MAYSCPGAVAAFSPATPEHAPTEIRVDQVAHRGLGFGMSLPGMIHPVGIVPVSLHIAHRSKRCLKCVVYLHFCGPGKLADVRPRVPGTDNEQSLAGSVKLPLQFRPLCILNRVRAEVHCHPVRIQAVEKEDRWAESLRVGRLACPVQPGVCQDGRDTRADKPPTRALQSISLVSSCPAAALCVSEHHSVGRQLAVRLSSHARYSRYTRSVALSNAERQRRFRQRQKERRLAAVPSLGPVGDGATPDGGFSPAGKRLWDSVLDEYELSEHELAVLRQACRQADRLEAIERALEGAPLTVRNVRGDLTSHPLLGESRQASALLARLIAALGLPSGVQDDAPAAPQRSSRRTHRPPFRGFYNVPGSG